MVAFVHLCASTMLIHVPYASVCVPAVLLNHPEQLPVLHHLCFTLTQKHRVWVSLQTNVLYLFISLITFIIFMLMFYNTFKTRPHDGSRQLIDTVSWKAYRTLTFIYIWHLAYFMIHELSL